jgi:hypothetical protein
MKLVYFEEFKEELDSAVLWYNSQVQGLGNTFAAAVAAAIDHIQRMPLAAPPFGQRYRRKQVKKFPYAVIYEVRDFELVIIALPHDRQRPGYWIARLP